MNNSLPGWHRRVTRVIVGAEWIAFTIGVIGMIAATEGGDALGYVAVALGGLWVLAATALRTEAISRTLVLDSLTLAGVVLTATALTLTGGADSPFYLLSLTPAIRAALFGGLRTALATGALSGMLLIAVSLARNELTPSSAGLAVLYLVMAATVAQIRRILVDLDERATSAEASSSKISTRLGHLEDANALLARLAEITAVDELNPISIGRAALEAIVERFPGSSGVAALDTESGPILVARYGTAIEPASDHLIPLRASDRQVGYIRLSTPRQLAPEEVEGLTTTLRPLALAFANALLLQQITKDAVKEERTRLARELHDDIGPSLASLGLSLDVALIQGVDQRDLTEHLEHLRQQVTGLVEEVRTTVSDLRTPAATSMVSHLERLWADLQTQIDLAVDLDERRPIRPSLAEDIHGIVSEAVRNAVRHSGTTRVNVKGWIDFDKGRVVVEDKGTGFDTSTNAEGRYGLVGMRERAAKSGVLIEITSGSDGTRVAVEWGPK